MPTISIFIRKDDLPKWKAIEKKSEWLHDCLDGNAFSKVVVSNLPKKSALTTVALIDESKARRTRVPQELAPKFCKNGHPIPYPKIKCMGKGCKYS